MNWKSTCLLSCFVLVAMTTTVHAQDGDSDLVDRALKKAGANYDGVIEVHSDSHVLGVNIVDATSGFREPAEAVLERANKSIAECAKKSLDRDTESARFEIEWRVTKAENARHIRTTTDNLGHGVADCFERGLEEGDSDQKDDAGEEDGDDGAVRLIVEWRADYSGRAVAFSGDGSKLVVGRGAGGMGLRGTGQGGGGEGFGRVGGLGKVETGEPDDDASSDDVGTRDKKQLTGKSNASNMSTTGGITDEQAKRVVAAKRNATTYCYERQLMVVGKSSFTGKVVPKLEIEPSGRVKSVDIASSTLGNKKVEACVARVHKRMKFPKLDGDSATVTYEIEFEAVSK